MSKDLLILYPTGIPVNVTFFIAIYRKEPFKTLKNVLKSRLNKEGLFYCLLYLINNK